jgi:ATP-dependent Clp protease ATP-binding subunit ClpA
VREEEGFAAKVLRNLGVELKRVRSAVAFIRSRGERILLGEIGLTPRANRVIELAADEARHLDHRYLGTEHLLLGLVREGLTREEQSELFDIAAGILASLGVTLETVRSQTMQMLNQPGSAQTKEITARVAPGQTEGGKQVLSLVNEEVYRFRPDFWVEILHLPTLTIAREEAYLLQHDYVGTEHVLLSLVRKGDGIAAKVLRELGIERDKVRGAVEAIVKRGDHPGSDELPLTGRVREVIAEATFEARQRKCDHLGTEHLLLGLGRLGESTATAILWSLGVKMETVRAKVIEVLQQA